MQRHSVELDKKHSNTKCYYKGYHSETLSDVIIAMHKWGLQHHKKVIEELSLPIVSDHK